MTTKTRRPRFKSVRETVSLESAVEMGKDELTCLHEELDEWRGNMEGTGLENTEKYQTLEESTELLQSAVDSVEMVEFEDVPETAKVSYMAYNPRKASRRVRGDFAVMLLQDSQGVCETVAEDFECQVQTLEDALPKDAEDTTEMTELRAKAETWSAHAESLRDACDELESVEFPGMYG